MYVTLYSRAATIGWSKKIKQMLTGSDFSNAAFLCHLWQQCFCWLHFSVAAHHAKIFPATAGKTKSQKKTLVRITPINSQNTLVYISSELVSNGRRGCVCMRVWSQFIHCPSTPTTDSASLSPFSSVLSVMLHSWGPIPLQSAVNITEHERPTVGTSVPRISATRCLRQVISKSEDKSTF